VCIYRSVLILAPPPINCTYFGLFFM